MKRKQFLPESWSRDIQNYRVAAARQSAKSPLSGSNNCRSTDLQRQRFEQRRREDEAYWRRLMGGAA